jgi:hypothetical protein
MLLAAERLADLSNQMRPTTDRRLRWILHLLKEKTQLNHFYPLPRSLDMIYNRKMTIQPIVPLRFLLRNTWERCRPKVVD